MNRNYLLIGVSVLVLTCGSVSAETATEKVTYHGQVEAIFKERCLGCHAGDRPKGRYDMSNLELVLKGGRKGEALVAGNPEESLLFQLITKQRKPFMPPRKAEPLTEEEIATIKAWILGGAVAGEPSQDVAPYSSPPQAADVHPRAGRHRHDLFRRRLQALRGGVPRDPGLRAKAGEECVSHGAIAR